MNFIHTFSKKNIDYGVRLLDNKNVDDIESYFELYYKSFGFRLSLDKAWFNWHNNLNPFGACNNYVLMDINANRMAGTYGFAKVLTNQAGEIIPAGLGVNGMIDEDYRRLGLYGDLMDISIERESTLSTFYSFPHGSNIGTIKGHMNANWVTLKKLYFYKKAIVESGSVSSAVEINTFDALGDIEFESFENNECTNFHRSKEWLSWRFSQRPHKKYNIIANTDKSGKVTGYMILGYYQQANSDLRCQVVDYRIQDSSTLYEMIKKAESTALSNGAKILDLLVDEFSVDLSVFIDEGFNKTEEYYEMLTYSKNGENNISVETKTALGDFDAV